MTDVKHIEMRSETAMRNNRPRLSSIHGLYNLYVYAFLLDLLLNF